MLQMFNKMVQTSHFRAKHSQISANPDWQWRGLKLGNGYKKGDSGEISPLSLPPGGREPAVQY